MKTALIVIDMQRDFLDAGGYAANAGLDVSLLRQAIVPISTLLAAARQKKLLVIHTREGHRPDLTDCPPAKLARSRSAGAEIGSIGPLGRLLVMGEQGHDIIDELYPKPYESVIDKPGYSAFAHTNLEFILRKNNIEQILFTGVTTEVCVHSSLRDAVDRGYQCVLVSDACASAYPHLHQAALDMVEVEGGIFGLVMDTAATLKAIEAGDFV